MSAVGWCIEKRWQHNRQPVIHTILGNQDAKDDCNQEMNYSEWCAINSYKGWLKYCDSSRLSEKYIEPIQPYADRYYKDHIKKGGKKHEKVRKSTQRTAA